MKETAYNRVLVFGYPACHFDWLFRSLLNTRVLPTRAQTKFFYTFYGCRRGTGSRRYSLWPWGDIRLITSFLFNLPPAELLINSELKCCLGNRRKKSMSKQTGKQIGKGKYKGSKSQRYSRCVHAFHAGCTGLWFGGVAERPWVYCLNMNDPV